MQPVQDMPAIGPVGKRAKLALAAAGAPRGSRQVLRRHGLPGHGQLRTAGAGRHRRLRRCEQAAPGVAGGRGLCRREAPLGQALPVVL